MGARSRQRHLLPALDRADGPRQRRQAARSDRQWRARHQLGVERRVVERNTLHPLVTRGLWRQNGATFTLIRPIVAVATARGSTTVKVDPTHAGVIYVNEFSRGDLALDRQRRDMGANQDAAQSPTSSTDRAEFDVTTLPNGKTRMYVGVGNQTDAGANRARFYRTDDATAAVPVFADMTTAQNIGYCTGQCWYDNVVYTPPGAPDVVYLGGSFSYGELQGPSNGRAWLLSTDGGATFSDLTQDADPNRAEAIHPDQHAIVTVPGKPLQFITGSDGGVVRSDGKFADISAKCDTRGLGPADSGAVQEPAEPGCEPARQHEQRLVHAAVPEPVGERAAAPEPSPGRHAGQRDVPVQRLSDRLATGYLWRRRPIRLQRRERRAALQHVHRPGERRELPRRRPDEVGDHLGADLLEPGGSRSSTRRSSPTRTRPGPARSSRARSPSGGRRTGAATRPISKPTAPSSRRSPASPAAATSFAIGPPDAPT